MTTKLHFSSVVAGAMPERFYHRMQPAVASIAAAQAAAENLRHGAEVSTATGTSFGTKIRAAIDRKSPRPTGSAVFAAATGVSASSGDKEFAKRLREAAEKKSGAKRYREQANRDQSPNS